jgi:NAD(P)-dependent dehydrogenase (short-subunit alcohol dehydrogenase family)
VTGGAGALGLEAARKLLEHGCSGDALAADFPNAKVITKVVDESWTELGKIGMLLCFAGVVGVMAAVDMLPEVFRRMCVLRRWPSMRPGLCVETGH